MVQILAKHTLRQRCTLALISLFATMSVSASSMAAEATPASKARWYRSYAQGIPTISSNISEQHMRNGYEVLDGNMQVIKRVAPYTPEQYAKQKALRDQTEARRQSDRNLVQVHISSVNATAQRDRILADMLARERFLQAQLDDLNKELESTIANAASFERNKKSIPFRVQEQIEQKRDQVRQAQSNLEALRKRQEEIRTQYASIISRLEYLESHRELLAPPKNFNERSS